MAYKYIGLDPSVAPSEIVVSDSTTSKAIELKIDLAKITDKGVIAGMLETIEGYVAVNLPVA
jgi:hypothetical protein